MLLNGKELIGWNIYNIPLDNIDQEVKTRATSKSAEEIISGSFFEIEIDIQQVGDTYLDMSKWSKGFVWVNSINLGRYWNIGP